MPPDGKVLVSVPVADSADTPEILGPKVMVAVPLTVAGDGLTVKVAPNWVRKTPSMSGTLPLTVTDPEAKEPFWKASDPLTSPMTGPETSGKLMSHAPHQISVPVTVLHWALGWLAAYDTVAVAMVTVFARANLVSVRLAELITPFDTARAAEAVPPPDRVLVTFRLQLPPPYVISKLLTLTMPNSATGPVLSFAAVRVRGDPLKVSDTVPVCFPCATVALPDQALPLYFTVSFEISSSPARLILSTVSDADFSMLFAYVRLPENFVEVFPPVLAVPDTFQAPPVE